MPHPPASAAPPRPRRASAWSGVCGLVIFLYSCALSWSIAFFVRRPKQRALRPLSLPAKHCRQASSPEQDLQTLLAALPPRVHWAVVCVRKCARAWTAVSRRGACQLGRGALPLLRRTNLAEARPIAHRRTASLRPLVLCDAHHRTPSSPSPSSVLAAGAARALKPAAACARLASAPLMLGVRGTWYLSAYMCGGELRAVPSVRVTLHFPRILARAAGSGTRITAHDASSSSLSSTAAAVGRAALRHRGGERADLREATSASSAASVSDSDSDTDWEGEGAVPWGLPAGPMGATKAGAGGAAIPFIEVILPSARTRPGGGHCRSSSIEIGFPRALADKYPSREDFAAFSVDLFGFEDWRG